MLITDFRMADNTTTHLTASAIAGLVAAVCSTPIDVVKTRVMNQQRLLNQASPTIYKGSIDCLIKV
jgi:ABC-type proline/glycine betaine transport system permease subunit